MALGQTLARVYGKIIEGKFHACLDEVSSERPEIVNAELHCGWSCKRRSEEVLLYIQGCRIRSQELQQPLWIASIDVRKAFDRFAWSATDAMMREIEHQKACANAFWKK